MSEREINQNVAEQICRDFQWKGQQFQLGDVVVLLDGEVFTVASSLGDALRKLRAVVPDPMRGMVFRVAPPKVNVIRKAQP